MSPIDSDNFEEYIGNEEVSMGESKTNGLTQIKASNSNYMLSNTLSSCYKKEFYFYCCVLL